MAECLGVDCDFTGTQDEVDDHFIECIRVGEPGHARMPESREPPPGFRGPVTRRGRCRHRHTQFIRLADREAGGATYCRDCHICIDSPYFGDRCDWAADAKCDACGFTGPTGEVQAHREAIRNAGHWSDPASVAIALDHGHIVRVPCEECGEMTPPVDFASIGGDHAEHCSHHPRNVTFPPGTRYVEIGTNVDGSTSYSINGVPQRPENEDDTEGGPEDEDDTEGAEDEDEDDDG